MPKKKNTTELSPPPFFFGIPPIGGWVSIFVAPFFVAHTTFDLISLHASVVGAGSMRSQYSLVQGRNTWGPNWKEQG